MTLVLILVLNVAVRCMQGRPGENYYELILQVKWVYQLCQTISNNRLEQLIIIKLISYVTLSMATQRRDITIENLETLMYNIII